MNWTPEVQNPKNMTKRQRHLLLNKAVEYDPTSPVAQYMTKHNTETVLHYKRVFIQQVHGKSPFDPAVLIALLHRIWCELASDETESGMTMGIEDVLAEQQGPL